MLHINAYRFFTKIQVYSLFQIYTTIELRIVWPYKCEVDGGIGQCPTLLNFAALTHQQQKNQVRFFLVTPCMCDFLVTSYSVLVSSVVYQPLCMCTLLHCYFMHNDRIHWLTLVTECLDQDTDKYCQRLGKMISLSETTLRRLYKLLI